MTKIAHLLAAAAVAATLAAPAYAAPPDAPVDAPSKATAPSLYQWQAMAAAEATTLAKQLGPHTGPWQVRSAAGVDSRFSQAFNAMLVSELASRGVKLTTQDSQSVIELQVQGNWVPGYQPYVPGTLTVVAAGLWLVKGITDVASPAVAATILAVGADALSTLADHREPTGAELAVTLVATKAGQVAASHTSLYLLTQRGTGAYVDQPGHVLKFAK